MLRKRIGSYPLGVWLAVIGLSSLMCGWAMQAYSLLNWNGAVDLGLQNERFSGDPVEHARALESWGVAAADMLWGLPITLIALWRVPQLRFTGLASGLMALSIGTYFPIVFAFQRWQSHPDTVYAALLLWALPSLLGIAGLLTNYRSFVNRGKKRA